MNAPRSHIKNPLHTADPETQLLSQIDLERRIEQTHRVRNTLREKKVQQLGQHLREDPGHGVLEPNVHPKRHRRQRPVAECHAREQLVLLFGRDLQANPNRELVQLRATVWKAGNSK